MLHTSIRKVSNSLWEPDCRLVWAAEPAPVHAVNAISIPRDTHKIISLQNQVQIIQQALQCIAGMPESWTSVGWINSQIDE